MAAVVVVVVVVSFASSFERTSVRLRCSRQKQLWSWRWRMRVTHYPTAGRILEPRARKAKRGVTVDRRRRRWAQQAMKKRAGLERGLDRGPRKGPARPGEGEIGGRADADGSKTQDFRRGLVCFFFWLAAVQVGLVALSFTWWAASRLHCCYAANCCGRSAGVELVERYKVSRCVSKGRLRQSSSLNLPRLHDAVGLSRSGCRDGRRRWFYRECCCRTRGTEKGMNQECRPSRSGGVGVGGQVRVGMERWHRGGRGHLFPQVEAQLGRRLGGFCFVSV